MPHLGLKLLGFALLEIVISSKNRETSKNEYNLKKLRLPQRIKTTSKKEDNLKTTKNTYKDKDDLKITKMTIKKTKIT